MKMYNAVKSLFKKVKEIKFLRFKEELNEEDGDRWLYRPAGEDCVDEAVVEKQDNNQEEEMDIRGRFQEVKDNIGNTYLEVKAPAIWYPGEKLDNFIWHEESAYNTKVFERIWNWMDNSEKEAGWIPRPERQMFEDGADDVFFERADEDPKACLSGGVGKLDWEQKCWMVDDWVGKAAEETDAEAHYDIEEFEQDYEDYEKYERTVPDDFTRFGPKLEMVLLDSGGY